MRNYSVGKIKKYMFYGIALIITDMIFAIMIYTSHNLLIKIGMTGIVLAGLIAYFYLIYINIYLPNLELQKLVEEYRKNEELKLNYRSGSKEDLIQEIQEIILSLDTMAIKQKNAEILMKNAEINNLQDQINPHFLYNTLEVIRGEALIKGDKKIAEMTASLANYFRYNISRKEAFVFLKDELKNCMNYFNIQKNRFGDKIFCEIVYHDTVKDKVGNCYIPKLILQPIIENAIYHGLELKMGPGTIKIHITESEESLIIHVVDDGLGMTQEKVDELNSDYDFENDDVSKKHNGVAIQNIKKRLKLYWGKRAYILVTSEIGEGTQVLIQMPLLYQKEDYMN